MSWRGQEISQDIYSSNVQSPLFKADTAKAAKVTRRAPAGACSVPPMSQRHPNSFVLRQNGLWRQERSWVAVPAQDHQGLPIVLAVAQIHGVGFQDGQAQLENGFDPVIEEAVHNIDSTFQGHDAKEKGKEPRKGDGR